MQSKLVYGILGMTAYALASPIAQPEDALLTNTDDIDRASSTPIDIKLDIGTFSKMFPLPPELQKLAKPGQPLELKISLGTPSKSERQTENEAAKAPNSRPGPPNIHGDGGIEIEESMPYNPYKGNGTPQQGWPMPEEWISYRSMKKLNYGVMMNSCSNNNWGVPDNSPQETDQIFQSIDVISRATLLDRRFILAILLQETKGCVRVHTTFSADGVRNQGLMQSHNGKSTCNSGTWGAPKDLLEPCPEAKILGMIYEGVVGASEDPDDVSLLKMITRSALGSVGDLYRAARMYNSGPEASLWNLEDGGAANGSYASDVANRMTGWVG